jgi:hypothetical protein
MSTSKAWKAKLEQNEPHYDTVVLLGICSGTELETVYSEVGPSLFEDYYIISNLIDTFLSECRI